MAGRSCLTSQLSTTLDQGIPKDWTDRDSRSIELGLGADWISSLADVR